MRLRDQRFINGILQRYLHFSEAYFCHAQLHNCCDHRHWLTSTRLMHRIDTNYFNEARSLFTLNFQHLLIL